MGEVGTGQTLERSPFLMLAWFPNSTLTSVYLDTTFLKIHLRNTLKSSHKNLTQNQHLCMIHPKHSCKISV